MKHTPRGYLPALLEECEQRITHMPAARGRVRTLDEHQQEAMMKICVAIQDRCTSTRHDAAAIVHCCSSGKTTLAANVIGASQAAKETLGLNGDRRDIILTTERAHTTAIRKELDDLGIEAGQWGNGERRLDHPVIITGIDAIQRKNKCELKRYLPLDKIDIIVGDEADRYLTQQRTSVVHRLSPTMRLGLTATPKWPDGRNISNLWGEIIDELDLKDGIRRGIATPPLWSLYEAAIDEDTLRTHRGDYKRRELGSALKHVEIERAVCELYRALIPENRRKEYPTLVYVPTAELVRTTVQRLQNEFAQEEVIVHGWTGDDTHPAQMRKDQNDMNDGKLDILVMCEMGGRAMNLPRARCLLDAYPTLSFNKLEHRHGRVLRKVRRGSALARAGFRKPFAISVQIVPHSNRFRPVCLPDLLDGWKEAEAGRLLGLENPNAGGPVADEIAAIRRRIEKHNPQVHLALLRNLDMYQEILRRDQLPQADQDGFFWHDQRQKWCGTRWAWHQWLGISMPTLSTRLKDKESVEGKDKGGQIGSFYAESTVWEACSDLLQEQPQIGKDGFSWNEEEEEWYGTIPAWHRWLGIPVHRIRVCLGEEQGIQGIDASGVPRSIYSENVIWESCADVLKGQPRSDADGFTRHEETGEWLGTLYAWSQWFGVGRESLNKRMSEVESIEGRSCIGQKVSFFTESSVWDACADLLQEQPQIYEDGLAWDEQKGDWFGTRTAWSKHLGIENKTVRKRLTGRESIQGKDAGGIPRRLYSQCNVWNACADLLEQMQAGQDGFCWSEETEEWYGTITVWSEWLKIDRRKLQKRMSCIEGIDGKDACRRPCKFYSEKQIWEQCHDLLGERAQEDAIAS